MRPVRRVDALGDARGIQPLVPGVAVCDEVHGVVVQEHVARKIRRLSQRWLASHEADARAAATPACAMW